MSWGLHPRLTICRPLQGLICCLIALYLGLTPQAEHLSPLRGSGGDKPRPYEGWNDFR